MSDKGKTPWYKRIYGFLERRVSSFGSFLLSLFTAWGIFFAGLFIYGLFNPVNPSDKIESTTSYSESSTVVSVYTHAKEGSDDFNKVIADLEFYNTKPEKTEVTRFVKSNFSGSKGYEITDSLIDGKDAESLYYLAKGSPMGFMEDLFNSVLEDSREDIGTLILYNKDKKTYTSKTIKGIKILNKSTKGKAEGYYHREYEGYQGAPKPVYSYSPTVELIAYKDGTYEWKSSDNWKLDNEKELKSYISSSPKKED